MILAMTLQQMFRSLSKEASPCCPISDGQRQWCLPSSAAAAARMSLQRIAMVCSCVFDAILSRTGLALPRNSAASHLAMHYVAGHTFSSSGQARASGPGKIQCKKAFSAGWRFGKLCFSHIHADPLPHAALEAV